MRKLYNTLKNLSSVFLIFFLIFLINLGYQYENKIKILHFNHKFKKKQIQKINKKQKIYYKSLIDYLNKYLLN